MSRWTTKTWLARSPAALLQRLTTTQANTPAGQDYVFALSKNTPARVVDAVHSLLAPAGAATQQHRSSQAGGAVGALVEPFSSSLFPQLATVATEPHQLYSLALAASHPGPSSTYRNVFYRSTLTGRENVAVGREIQSKSRRYGDGSRDRTVDEGFETFLQGGKAWNFGQNSRSPAKDAVIGELEGVP